MIKAVIFDMDGVLMETAHLHNKAWVKFLGNYGINVPESEYYKFRGIATRDTIKKHMPHAQGELLLRLVEERAQAFEEVLEEVEPLAGVVDFLKQLKKRKIPYAVATSSVKRTARLLLKKTNLEKYIKVLVTADDVQRAKPDPEIYLLAAKKLGVSPSECLVFEDALAGVEAAQKAGCRVAAITTTHKKEEFEGVDLAFADFTKIDLDALLRMRE